VLHDTQIRQIAFGDQLAEVADARRMHFDTQIIDFRLLRSDRGRCFAHAETDFDDARRATTEKRR